MLQNLVVVRSDIAKTHGDRQKAGRLRRQIMSIGVRAADDGGDGHDRRVAIEPVLSNEGVEAAAVADMSLG